MRLYDFLFSGNGYKVRLALRWLGLPFEYHSIDILKGESRTPAFLAKNPFGQTPDSSLRAWFDRVRAQRGFLPIDQVPS